MSTKRKSSLTGPFYRRFSPKCKAELELVATRWSKATDRRVDNDVLTSALGLCSQADLTYVIETATVILRCKPALH